MTSTTKSTSTRRERALSPVTLESGELTVRNEPPLLRAYPGSRRLEVLFQIPATDQLRAALQHRGVPADRQLWHADTAQKLDAMSSFRTSFLSTEESTTFVEIVLGRVRRHLALKNFGDEHYRRFYHQTVNVMRGASLVPLPPSMASLKGGCLSLIGPSMTGKTALLQRIRAMLGSSFQVSSRTRASSSEPAPALINVIPFLNISYPECNTLKGFLRDMRERLIPCISTNEMSPQKVLTDLLGANGDNAAIAACILLNVSLITVDGANFNSIGGNPFEIPAFLLKLQEYSGIPVLFSGTCAFMHFMSLKGSPSANLFGEPSLHLDPNEAPKLGEDQRPVGEGVWYQKNVWYWSLGMFSRDIPMPEYLPVWTYSAARGRDGWLAEGFEALHTELIKKPRLLEPGKLTEEVVTKVFELRLRPQREARVAITQQQEQDYVEDEEDFFNFMDHFPLSFIRNKTNKSRIRAAMGSR